MKATPFIFTGYAPNESRNECMTALSWLCNPKYWPQWRHRSGLFVRQTETWLQNKFKTNHAFTLDSGRSALLLTLKALGVQAGDEVLVQAFTCVVVINAIRWAGATPIFVDCTENFTTDLEDVRRKVTSRTKVLIIQHTFGYSAAVTEIITWAKNNGIFTIEDCAHALGATKNGQLLGTFGDAAIFSFGSDKVVSSVRGGAIITQNIQLAEKIATLIATLPSMPLRYLLPHVLHVPIFYICKKYYTALGGVGKWVLAFTQKIGLINRILYAPEKTGSHMRPFPTTFPNVLAAFVQNQLTALDKINDERKKQAKKYFAEINNPQVTLPPNDPETIFLRFPLLVNNPSIWDSAAQKAQIQLGNWYDSVIAPKNATQTGYVLGSCPRAENIAARIINIPIGPHVSEKIQNQVIAFVRAQA